MTAQLLIREHQDVGGQEDSGEVDLNNEFNEVTEQEEPAIVINEDALLSGSGISDNSSNVAPDQLTTSDDIGGELGASDLFEVEQEEEEPAEETTEEVQDTTAETVQQEAIEEKMSANVSVRADSFIESLPKNTLVATTAVEGEGMTYALEDDFGVFKVNKKGKIKTKGFLDFETNEKYDLVLLVTNKKGKVVKVPFTINIGDVSELSATSSVRAANFHEGTTSVNTIVADINPQSDETPTYEITGEGKDYFRINNNGKIKLDKSLDANDKKIFNLVVKVSAGTETINVPVSINVLENIAPDFAATCQSSCSLAESTSTGTVIINASRTDSDIDDLTYSLENNFSNKFSINQTTGQVTLNSALDYETRTSYDLKVIATDSKGVTKERSSTFNVTDVVVGLSGNLASASKAENIAAGTVILNSAVSGFAGATYSLSGGNSKFAINSSTGQVTLANALDYETATSHTFTVTAEAGGETQSESFTLNVSDINLGFSGSLVSASKSEVTAAGSVILNSAVSGFAGATYSLSGGNSKFAINSSTGQVTLANALDYETATSHTFTVSATAGGETETSNFTLNVDNYTYTLSDSAASTSTVKKGTYLRSGLNNYTYLLDEDLTTKGASDRVIGDFSTGVAGTVYTLTGANSDNFTIDSAGIVSYKSGLNQNLLQINEGYTQNTGTRYLSITADIPGEGQISTPTIYLKGKNVESNENLVMKFASGYNNKVHNFEGADPFKASAHRNASGSGGHNNQVVTESTLSVADQASSSHVDNINDSYYVRYGQGNGKTYYRTSTVANGDNEKDTEILDFEYWFPVDTSTSTSTARQYAPMSEANAGWDTARPAREEAKYACLDSGQGCGGGTTEHSLSGNWTATTESSGGSFTGYKVTQRNFSRDTDNLLNASPTGSSVRDGSGTHTLLGEYNTGFGRTSSSQMSEFEIVALPETFNYFGQSFSHIYVNENGFLTFGNSGTNKPWDDFSFNNTGDRNYPYKGGGRPLQYLAEAAYNGSHSSYKPDGYQFPDIYGKPGTDNADNLDNTIFALWNDFITDADNTDWSIRQLWNSATKILTIGWYNIRSYNNTNNNREANFEVQLNFTDDSFRIVHGDFGDKFPGDTKNNVFVGVSKDVSCATSTNDISMCEGKDYIQLYFHDNHFGRYENPNSNHSSFQSRQGQLASSINHLYNSYFTNNQTVNGTEYCFNNTTNLGNTSCSNTYSGQNQAKGGTHFTFNPQGGGPTKNVLLPSNIKQSYRSGHTTEFIWMHLDKDPTALTYTPPANNATGFEVGANARDGFIGGSLSAGSAINHTTATDEIVIGGEVYTASKLETFLNNTKKVVAYAPIPLLHTNKYELAQYAGQSDVRFRRAHTIMPNFISTDYMESKDNGTDANFDFHQLRDDDHCKGNFSCIVYNTDGSTSFTAQDGSHLPKPKRTLMVCMPMLLKHWITTRMSTQIVLAIQCFGRNTCLLDNRFGIRFTTQPAEVWVYLRNSIGVVEPVNLVVNFPLIKVEPHIILNIVCFLS
jgi:hypothetical protein